MWNESSPIFSMDFCDVECIFSRFLHGLFVMWNASSPIFSMDFLLCGLHLLPFSPWTLCCVECIFSHSPHGLHLLPFSPYVECIFSHFRHGLFFMLNASSPIFSMDFCDVECIFFHFRHGLLLCYLHLLPFSPWTF